MTRPAPHTVPPARVFPDPLTNPADPRLRHRIQQWDGEPADAILLGVPFDLGVKLNGGRVGAAAGPAAFRTALERFGTTYDLHHRVDFDGLKLADAGDIDVVGDDVHETHTRHTAACVRLLEKGAVPLVVGGGNDISFASARALNTFAQATQADGAIGAINIDAHFDVREVVDGVAHSGTPYRRVLEELRVPGNRFVEFGVHAAVNSRAHHEWLLAQGAACWTVDAVRETGARKAFTDELDRLADACTHLFVSFDLDVFEAAHAPGVSAPGTCGLTPLEGREIAFAAGAHPRVRMFELMEFNPAYDLDSRTGRLAAMLLTSFLAGLATR